MSYAPRGLIGPELGDDEVFAAGDELHMFHLTLPNHDVVQHVCLHADNKGGGYFIEFAPGRDEVSLQKWLQPRDRPTYGYSELQRGRLSRPLPVGRPVPFKLLSVDSYLELELDGEVVLATLSRASSGGRFGAWAENGTIRIENPRWSPMRRPQNN